MAEKPKLRQIKTGAFSRGFALARMSMSAGAKAAGHAIGNVFASDEDKPDRLKAFVMSQLEALSTELGQLKGSLMKVGQMLSMYGEQFLPPEANAILKSLQSQSPPLAWEAIEPVLRKQLGPEKLARLEIDPEAWASASLGQVHRGRVLETGREVAVKVQYPGVDQAIESDLRTLRRLLSMSKLIPKGPKYDELFKEVQRMLHQEVDYEREAEATREFKAALAHDPRYVIADVVEEFSTKRVIVTDFLEGVAVDSPEVQALSQERRNALGLAFLELYFYEVFRLGKVQTDPHFGNYRVKLGQGGEPDRLVLLDFGAVRKFPKSFLEPYTEMARGVLGEDQKRFEKGAEELGFLIPEDLQELRDQFFHFVHFFMEPFWDPAAGGREPSNEWEPPMHLYGSDGAYDWGASDLPKRAARVGAEIAISVKLRAPPREIVFLDRKMGGVFIFLSVLKVKIRSREMLQKYVEK